MKKSVFVIALMASLLAGAADTDSYLYWMVDVEEGNWDYSYSVQISGKLKDGGNTESLEIYNFNGSIGKSIGKTELKTYKENSFGLYTLLGSQYSSYVIELLSDKNEIVGSQSFEDVAVSDYIARSGMSNPPLDMYMPTIALQAPEPSSGLLLLLGVAGLALRRRKQITA